MKFLALEHETPGATTGQFQPHLKAEARYLWEMVQAGVVRETYFRADQHEAVLMLECANADEAREKLAGLPLVQAGLIEFEIIPLVPYDGFARLFES
jgi:hypothetical protein